MDLITRKQKMLEFKDQLKEFTKSLDDVITNWGSKLQELHCSGLDDYIFNYYFEFYFKGEAKTIEDLSETILSAHIDYIDKVVSDIDKAINRK